MLVQANQSGKSTYVIVVGNEKGGSGKSTLAIHVAIGLMQAGQRVATIDLDSRQQSLTHYIENRAAWRRRTGLDLHVPSHCFVARCEGLRNDENEAAEFDRFIERIAAAEPEHDFIVVDTPGSDCYLMRLAHAMADTLITPLNDSFVDFDVLGAVDPVTYALTQTSHYAEMVRDARRARRKVDQNDLDWIVVRNRLSSTRSRNKSHVADGLERARLAARLPPRGRLHRAHDLSRTVPARADGVRYRQARARQAPEPVAHDGAAGGAGFACGAAAAGRRKRPAAGGRPGRMVCQRKPPARAR